jgi:prepilin-type N-terminal cleavage/methylation domain-containing protein
MRTGERGLTLIEILIALAIFAIVVVGALGAVGAANMGLTDTFSTGFGTGRNSKDYTVATSYLQGFQEFMAQYVDASTIGTLDTGLPHTFTPSSPDVFGFPVPSERPYQLNWTSMAVSVQPWYWNCDNPGQYSPTPSPSAGPTNDQVIYVRASLTWAVKGANRTLTVERFVPYHPDFGLVVTSCP